MIAAITTGDASVTQKGERHATAKHRGSATQSASPGTDGGQIHPPVPRQRPGGGPHGSPSADQSYEVARTRARRRFLAGRAARDDAEAGPLLGDRIRLAQGRGEAE